jgi:hypothetical protein
MPRSIRVPDRVPSGTKYVVEGRAGTDGQFRVSARYLVYPDGRRLDVGGETVLPISCCGKASRKSGRPPRRSSEAVLQLGA